MEVDLEGVARIHRGLPLHLHVVQGGFVGGAEGEHGSPHILVQGEVNRYKQVQNLVALRERLIMGLGENTL